MKVIRNKNDHDLFWSFDSGWVERENADEILEFNPADLPHDGELVDRRYGLTFRIVRKFKDRNRDDELIKTDLTIDEAREHCESDDSEGDGWMDVFYEE